MLVTMDVNDSGELDASYLVPEISLFEYSARLVDGDKLGSKWLVISDKYIYHKNDISVEGDQTYWVCARRTQTRHFIRLLFFYHKPYL